MITIGDIRSSMLVAKTTRKRSEPKRCRLKNWTHASNYTCIREGTRTFTHEDTIHGLFLEGNLTEDLFFIFKHRDPNMERDPMVPKYEAVYKCEFEGRHYFICVQKQHLQQAYSKAGRTDVDRCDDLLEDGTPYYVDRWISCKRKQHASKQRYEEKKNKRHSP